MKNNRSRNIEKLDRFAAKVIKCDGGKNGGRIAHVCPYCGSVNTIVTSDPENNNRGSALFCNECSDYVDYWA